MSPEHRRFERILAQRFGGCTVRLNTPSVANAVLADISVGGMKIMISAPLADALKGTAVQGEIHHENPAFHLVFEGRIAWSKTVPEGDTAAILGIQFADYTPLPEALMNLVEVYDH